MATSISPTDWSFRLEKGSPTLHPSIGNWGLPCRSHYWIRHGKVIWASDWSQEQIDLGRQLDRAAKQRYFDANKNMGVSGHLGTKIWNVILGWRATFEEWLKG